MPKISALTPAVDLDGSETVVMVKAGATRRGPIGGLVAAAVAPSLLAMSVSLAGAELARDQAADLVSTANIFVDVPLATAEAAVANGTVFKLVNSGTALADVRRRTIAGSDLLYQEATAAALAGASGSTLMGFRQASVDAVSRTVEEELRDRVSVTQFGAKCDGVTYDDAALLKATNFCFANNKDLEIPGLCRLANSVNLDRLVDSAPTDNYFTIWSGTGGGFIVDDDITIFSTTLVNAENPNFPVSQMIRFSGLKFEADVNTRNAWVLDRNRFLRIVFENCNFRKIRCLEAPVGMLTQTITFQNCQARRWLGTFFKSKEITFDLKVIGGLWEAGVEAFDIDFPVGCAFIGANIEGMANFAIKYKGGYGLAVQGCYFEENGGSIPGGASIDGSEAVGAAASENVLIEGNYFAGVATQPAKSQILWGDTVTATSIANLCTTTLHHFGTNSRVNVIGDHARTSLANTETKHYFRAINDQTYGGVVSQSFIAGRGGLLLLRSMQNNAPSPKGVTIAETGNVGFGTDNPQADTHTHLTTSARPRHFLSNGTLGPTYGAFISGYSVTGEGGQAAIGTVQEGVFSEAIIVDEVHTLRPATDNAQNLASPAARFNNSFFAVAPTVTSDERKKLWRGELEEAELRAAKRIIAELGIYQWKDVVDAKGAGSARLHYGVRAQRAFAILEQEGLDWQRYAWCCHDRWLEKTEPVFAEVTVTKTRTVQRLVEPFDPVAKKRPVFDDVEEEYEETEMQPTGATRVTQAAGDLYGVRTDQLAFWLITAQAAIQADLEGRVMALENAAAGAVASD